MFRTWGVVALALVSACKDEGKTEPASPSGSSAPSAPKTAVASGSGSAQPATSAGSAAAAGSAGSAAAGSATPTPPPEKLPPPLKTQLAYKMTAGKFLGWSEDGRMFVIEATHGMDLGAMGGSNKLVLRQVHDAATGKMIDSYRVSRAKDSDVKRNDKLVLAYNEAKKLEAWTDFEKAHPLAGATPQLASPDGAWTVKPHKGTKRGQEELAIRASKDRIEVRWEGFGGDGGGQDDDPWDAGDEPAPANKSAGKSPSVKLQLVHDKETWEHLAVRIPFGAKAILDAAEGKPHVRGTLTAHWSPQRNRVVWLTTFTVEGVNEESPMVDARFYVRAVGPQLKVLDAGAGDEKARTIVESLETAGFGVTGLERSEKASSGSQVYYRGPAKAVADKVRAKLGDPFVVEELKKPGWVDVIVVAGQ